MDVYNYSLYLAHQYSQSDEPAKQMFAQQALSNPSPVMRNNPEPHIMPAPSGAPWNVKDLPWGIPSPPQLVQFTAQTSAIEPKLTPVIHCKRKTVDVEPAIPAKQLITEEKMAAHLSGLHISTDYTAHSFASDEMMDVNMETPSTSFNEKLKGHKIILSDEIKKLQGEPLLPPALIERLEKPCMSLVVWKPKENIIESKLKEEEKKKSQVEENITEKRRNGILVSEQIGAMDVEM